MFDPNNFDVNASLDRQFTREGMKIIGIYDSGLDVVYPICAWKEDGVFMALTKNGLYFQSGTLSSMDVITKPEPKPLMITYTDFLVNKSNGVLHNFSTSADASRECTRYDFIRRERTTYNPNTGEVTKEVV